ncbi:MAG: 3'-5' exoribonuclease [Saprospiraceae bacterium]|nr:3'-5' exoribonuclease [Saprospiraceae bacterium]
MWKLSGTGDSPPILSIAAVHFKLDKVDKFSDIYAVKPSGFNSTTMVANLDPQDQINRGSKVSFSTILWWMRQSRAAQNLTFFNKDRPDENPKIVLDELNYFITRYATSPNYDNVYLWSNGALADIRWLENLYAMYGVDELVGFRNKMCYRTIRNILDWNAIYIPESVMHDCLSDTIYQVVQLQSMCEVMSQK